MGRVSAGGIREAQEFGESLEVVRSVEGVEFTEYNEGIEMDTLEPTIRKLYSALMLIKTIPTTFSPEDLLKASHPNKWLREYSEGLIKSYEQLLSDESYEDDGDVPIRFVDYAYSNLLKVYATVTAELTREDLVEIGCITDLANSWKSSGSDVSDSKDQNDLTGGVVASVVVGVVVVGVIAGIALTLKNRKSAKREDNSVENGDA